jgi:hypothetical protein
VVITDPKEIQDPLSEVVINLAREIQELKRELAHHEHRVPDDTFVGYTDQTQSTDEAIAALSARERKKARGES